MATGANLAAQALFFGAYSGANELGIAIAVGTIAGLVVKYVLDKKWIFFDQESGFVHNGRKFILYSSTGVFTTAIFWATEIAFNAISDATIFRLIGAALGLSIGYSLKYFLDARFVFRVTLP